jgi:hypothetical protein
MRVVASRRGEAISLLADNKKPMRLIHVKIATP